MTNAVERLAGEVILANALPSSETVVIEHYPAESRPPNPETFDLVTFEHADPEPVLRAGAIEIGEPSWLRIDRRAVETLIGHPLRPRRARPTGVRRRKGRRRSRKTRHGNSEASLVDWRGVLRGDRGGKG